MLPFAISGPHLIVEEDCVNTVRLDVGDEVLKFDEDDVSRWENGSSRLLIHRRSVFADKPQNFAASWMVR
jgi:hypothetical protein